MDFPTDEGAVNMPPAELTTTVVNEQDIDALLEKFASKTYAAVDDNEGTNVVLEKCLALFGLDHDVHVISNKGGRMCYHYPSKVAILQHAGFRVRQPDQNISVNVIYEEIINAATYEKLVMECRIARCRTRFPVPVILFGGKYMCRSATLSGGPEMLGRSSIEYLSGDAEAPNSDTDTDNDKENPQPRLIPAIEFQLHDKMRGADIALLKALNVRHIVDLMVEKKKVKYMLNVSSSEKVDKESRYKDFNLLSLPYPGCEFFEQYRKNNYEGVDLKFDWSQPFVNAPISVPSDSLTNKLDIDWTKYKEWDLNQITQNYLKVLLLHMNEGSSGVLLHCISGWDRTPLFVSLMRMTLWADGLIHQNLDVFQIIYLTIGYDWMLFGHHLVDRLTKGEDIFFFCFNFLKMIANDDFSLVGPFYNKPIDVADGNNMDDKFEDVMRFKDLLDKVEIPAQGDTSSEDDGTSSTTSTGSSASSSYETYHSAPKSPPKVGDQASAASGSRKRQRNDSSSPTSSWNVVLETGSIHDPDYDYGSNLVWDPPTSSSPVREEDARISRLLSARSVFLKSYHRKIGFKYMNHNTWSHILTNLADTVVGLIPTAAGEEPGVMDEATEERAAEDENNEEEVEEEIEVETEVEIEAEDEVEILPEIIDLVDDDDEDEAMLQE